MQREKENTKYFVDVFLLVYAQKQLIPPTQTPLRLPKT